MIPASIVAAGGRIDHFGMPVDPGNLLLLGHVAERVVLGLPGCARSPKVNGFDWVLERLVAGLPVGSAEIMRMGTGGLLAEIPSRPMPRAEATPAPGPKPEAKPPGPRIGALLLAAGQSRRMGGPNKLLAEVDGTPMVAHVARRLLASRARPIIAVLGNQAEAVDAALGKLPVERVRNPEFANGLSTSLKRGIAALPADLDGALVCLGDMPLISGRHLDRLIAAFNPLEGRAIVVPTRSESIFPRDGRTRRRYRSQAPDRRARRTRRRSRDGRRRRPRRHRHSRGTRRAAAKGETRSRGGASRFPPVTDGPALTTP